MTTTDTPDCVQRISLIIAGGVSLGAFEAGAITEILYAVEHINTTCRKGDPLRIDVLTGASAGSLTAAMAARIIMHARVDRPHLHDAWVTDADINAILQFDNPTSLLSNQFPRTLAEKYIARPIGTDSRCPASCAPDTLYLHFALANMAGIDYSIPHGRAPDGDRASSVGFTTTFFSDHYETELTPNDVAPSVWKDIAAAAIASGSFPIAFPPFGLYRRRPARPPSFYAADNVPGWHAFADGGMFNNEPIKAAITLARRADRDQPSPNRVFVLIDPNINQSRTNEHYWSCTPQTHARFNPDTTMPNNLLRLVAMVYGEAQARDWMRTTRVTEQLRWRNDIVSIIDLLTENLSDDRLARIQQQVDPMLDQVIASDDARSRTTTTDEYRAALVHTAELFERQIPGLKDGVSEKGTRNSVTLRLLYGINRIAHLHKKAPIHLFPIGVDSDDAAGDPLNGFAGFFEKDWREHDYRLGRRRAHALLPRILGVSYGREDRADYCPDSRWISKYGKPLSQVTINDAGHASRKLVRRRMTTKTRKMIDHAMGNLRTRPVRWLGRTVLAPVFAWLAKKCVFDELLGLK